jgi:hypothetical protein
LCCRDWLLAVLASCRREDALLALSDSALKLVMSVAGGMPVEKRDIFLQRLSAQLALWGRYSDADVERAAALTSRGLVIQKVG